MKNLISILVVIVTFGYVNAQDIQYVKAENGLIIREKPNQGATRLGMLDYGTAIEITQHTNLKLDVIDGGKKISGEWVKVRSIDAYDVFDEGYVFNGFLTQRKLQKRFKMSYDEFTVNIDGLIEKKALEDTINPEFNSVIIYKLKDNESVEDKIINIKHHQEFRSIEVFQKHENSIAISDNESHCDLIHWKHYYSSWRPLNTIVNHKKFKTLRISQQEKSRFIEIDIDTLKAEVGDNCGTSWSNTIKDIKTVNDFPASITLSKVFFKILMTDIEGNKIEKIIIFEVPLDTEKLDSYAQR